jgi:hypothetical protein
MRRRLVTLAVALAATLAVVATAAGAPPVQASGPSPFSGCTADNVGAQQLQLGSTLYMNAEPEMRSTINPTNPLNIVGAYQQDRWDDGGARGLVASWSKDGGQTWHPVVLPGDTRCSGGRYDRASDPWVSFAPNGDLYSISLSFDVFDTHNAIIVNKSTNGGTSWGPALEITADDTNGLDKEAITADPYNANLVYAVWDRFLSPPGINASDQGKFHAQSYVEQTWFSRTTDGGRTWEPARVAYDPGTHAGTIGNIVVVLPNATHDLLDGMVLFADHKSQLRGSQIAVVRSSDHGATWSKKATVIGQIDPTFFGATDPDNGHLIRGGDLPDFAVDPHNGNVYAAWDDDSLNGIDTIFFSQSTDSGATWSAPIKINKTPTNIPAGDQQAFTATLGVLANGTVGVTYYDLRQNDGAPGLPTNAWLVRCSANCASAAGWGNEAHVGGPFDLEQAADAGGYFVGDYEGMTTNGNVFQPFFGMAVNRAFDPSDAFFATLP